MATLTFVTPDGAENQFDLAGELVVGREAGNDVVLPEGGLSRKHARFFEDSGQLMVEDLGSSNGTFVDGERIEAPTAIAPGQEVLVANIKVVVGGGKQAGAPRRQSPAARAKNGSSAKTGMIDKPNLPAKRNGTPARGGPPARRNSGGPAPAPTGDDEAPAAGGARAMLKGQTGPWAGKRFALSKPVSVVGRVAGNDVVIEDDSVSRKHAEVRKSGPGYLVRDLQSANGTFVNGERISEAPLRPGDVVKFGVVEFTYSGPAMGAFRAAAGADSAAKKKKMLMFGGGGAVLLLVVGLAAAKLTEAPPTVSHDAVRMDGAKDEGPDVQQLLGQCKSFSDIDGNTLEWERAVKSCDAVLKLDPINVDARKLKKVAEKELSQKKFYDQGQKLVSLGQDEDAMAEFLKIDKDSYYIRLARVEFKKAAPIAQKHAAELCQIYWKSQNFDRAWPQCKVFMDVGYYLNNTDTSLEYRNAKTAFDDLSKRMKGKDDWKAREDYAIFLGTLTRTTDDRGAAIKQMYKDPELAAAVQKFASDPVLGMNAVQRYLGKGGKDAAQAKQVFQRMEQMYSTNQIGYERMLNGDLKGAAEAIKTAMEADGSIMPQGYNSDKAREMRKDIARKFASKGKELFTMGRLPESFEQCSRGGEFALGDPLVLECFSDLEKTASEKVNSGCDDANLAMRITRKESPTHKRAEDFVKAQCK